MQTDPARVRRTDPGDPDKCPVWDLHKIYSDEATRQWASEGCRSAGIGCLDCKQPLIDKIVEEVTAMRRRGQEFEEHPDLIRDIVAEGRGEGARSWRARPWKTCAARCICAPNGTVDETRTEARRLERAAAAAAGRSLAGAGGDELLPSSTASR